MSAVRLENVTKTFGAMHVIKDVSLHIDDGSFTVFVGPSGCGKSTLLRIISGLESPTSGAVVLGGIDVTDFEPADRGIAMVFQSYALYPHMTVAQNIAFGLRMSGAPKSEIERKIAGVAESLKLTELLGRRPKELSGGQRQRVAIGRAIARNPKVFLFDEPLSNLDAALRTHMRLELMQLHKRLRSTMIYVTHDQVEAMTLADKIVVLDQGRIMQVGSPQELYNKPANTFVAGFIGSPKMNLLPGGTALGQEGTTVGIRPEHIKLSARDGHFAGIIKIVENLGNEVLLHIDAGHLGDLVVRDDGDCQYQQGDTVGIVVPPGRLHHFDASGLRLEA